MKRFIIATICLALLTVSNVPGQNAKQKAEVDDLIKVLKNSKDAKQRVEACNELAELGTVRIALIRPAVPVLLDAVKDAEVEVRKSAITALSLIEPYKQEWIPTLIGRLPEGEDRGVRITAIAMLGGVEKGAKEAIPLLEDVLKKEADKPEGNRDGELIQTAVGAIEGVRAWMVYGCMEVLQTEKDPAKKVTAAKDIAKIGQIKVELVKPAIPVLKQALKDEDAGVRAYSLNALAIAGPEPQEVVKPLIGMLSNVKEDRGVRVAVVGYLGALGPNAVDAVPFLEVILERENKKLAPSRDKELYEAITKALAAIKQPQQ